MAGGGGVDHIPLKIAAALQQPGESKSIPSWKIRVNKRLKVNWRS